MMKYAYPIRLGAGFRIQHLHWKILYNMPRGQKKKLQYIINCLAKKHYYVGFQYKSNWTRLDTDYDLLKLTVFLCSQMLEEKQEAKYLDYTAIFWGYTLAGRKVNSYNGILVNLIFKNKVS
jgi:hypothetical protein